MPIPAESPRSAMNITPETYARWRESALGTLTEQLEQRVVFSLVGDPSGLRVLDVGCGDGVYAGTSCGKC